MGMERQTSVTVDEQEDCITEAGRDRQGGPGLRADIIRNSGASVGNRMEGNSSLPQSPLTDDRPIFHQPQSCPGLSAWPIVSGLGQAACAARE